MIIVNNIINITSLSIVNYTYLSRLIILWIIMIFELYYFGILVFIHII